MAQTIIRLFVSVAVIAMLAGCQTVPAERSKPPAFRDFSPLSEP